ncbi:ATP-dependent helicase [Thermus sp. PS18]|uniref:ATP-dependent helicase n=1 Tax=Thermus sp. PS18 TaxID=2849039 RepID=UPI002264430A|nr:ATP-dependent helicase [Thermus sp. PS18]UZX16537.1 ATP-dependent helicase [Thermus sp. PS18]
MTLTTSSRLRVYGPPGTGKTTWLQGEVERLLRSGVPGEEVAVCSFSRAAFREFAGRLAGRVPEENLGTIHSLAYRAIGRPPLALTREALEDWNRKVPDTWRITPRVDARGLDLLDVMDPYEDEDSRPYGDRLYDRVVYLRNTLAPMAGWTEEERAFAQAWKSWMNGQGVVDFPGMLELALARPGGLGVRFLLVDEAQDLTPLQLRLVLKWAQGARLALVGDDDQAIYGFMGADGVSFLSVPVDGEIVLSQSHRVPARVQRVAEAIAARITTRAPKRYAPRDKEGEVRLFWVPPEEPYHAVADALERVTRGESVLFLATAKYLLEELKEELLLRGEPYANPYAPHRHSFNLFPQGAKSAWERARSFLFPNRIAADVKAWAKYVRAGVFATPATKAREYLNAFPDEEKLTDDHPIWNVFRPGHRERAVARDVSWLLDHLVGRAPKTMRQCLLVALRNPQAVLQGRARVWLGTIHSVKGGEADWVYVWPGYTRKAAREHPDQLHRLFYVAATRARKGLVLMDQGKAPHAYPWPGVREEVRAW